MSASSVRSPDSANGKPASAHVDDKAVENIPLDMRLMPCWVAWRWEYRDGKWTKPPIDPLTGNSLDATGPDSWMTFDGKSEMTPVLPVNVVFFATGNNLGVRGDALRRIVPCRLETTEERPEERTGFTIHGNGRGRIGPPRQRLT
jgi:hypothetical protein